MRIRRWAARLLAAALVSSLFVGVALATGQVVTGSVNFNASFAPVTSAGLTSNTLSQVVAHIDTYSNGTGSNQVNLIYANKLTLAASATTLDLSSLTDPSTNASVNFARVREFIVFNPDATAGHDVKVSQGVSNGWATLPPAANYIPSRYGNTVVRISDPTSTGSGNGNVVGGTSKTATFDPGANTVTIYILITGCDAA